jgi:hypothetical protein
MNQEQKAQRYDWLLGEYKRIEHQINMVPKLPLEETLGDIYSREYSVENQIKVDNLKLMLRNIDNEVKKLF